MALLWLVAYPDGQPRLPASATADAGPGPGKRPRLLLPRPQWLQQLLADAPVECKLGHAGARRATQPVASALVQVTAGKEFIGPLTDWNREE
eukprot:14790233-Alexandrium_andersonii.AAC.1